MQEYQQRPGTVNLGDEYEHLIPALYALRAVCRPDIVDVWLASNAEGMGAFDDVILCLQYENGQRKAYVMQLKHREKKSITAASFASSSDAYSVSKYQKSFEEIMQSDKTNNNRSAKLLENVDAENIQFIIYTTADLAETIDKKIMKTLNLALFKPDVDQQETSFLNTNISNENCVYKLKLDDENAAGYNETFLSQFYFYVRQGQTTLVEHLIQQLINEKLGNSDPNIKLNFLNFIKMWARGDLGGHYKLAKTEIQLRLTELLLDSYLIEPKTFSQFKKADIWNEIVNSAQVTVIENYKEEMESMMWSAINSILYKYTDKRLKENESWEKSLGIKLFDLPKKYNKQGLQTLTLKQVGTGREITMKNLYLVLWKAGLLPLLVKADHISDAKNVYSALLLSSQEPNKRRVILLFKGEDKNLTKLFKNHSAIQTLADVKDVNLVQNTLEYLEVSLQGRKPIPLSNIIEKDNDILKEITTEMVLNMLYRPLVIGHKCDDLPKNYIKRSITKVLLSEEVLKVPDTAFVVNGSGNIVETLRSITHSSSVIDGKNYFKTIGAKENENMPNVVALEEGAVLGLPERRHFSSNKSGIHYLRYCNGHLEWSYSVGSIDGIRKYLKNFPVNSESSVSEEEMLEHFSHNVNIISSNPGMGKSVMINRLAEKCMEDHWVVRIILNNHHKYFKNTDNPTLNHFSNINFSEGTPLCYENFALSLISILKQKKKVLALVDAFDEISPKCIGAVIKLAKRIEKEGYRLWITTRPARNPYLENKLNAFSLSLNPFTAADQKMFLKNYFQKKQEHDVDAFVEKLQNMMSKSFTNWDVGFLSVPLHLHMVSEVFEDKNIADLNKLEEINTIDLYDAFINNKLDVYWKKMFGDNENGLNERMYKKQIRRLKNQHGKAALLLFYPKESLVKIFDYEDVEEFLEETMTGDENIGLITSIVDLDRPIFSHRTFAEYLAAIFLASKCENENIRPLLIALFDEELTILRQLFDRILAKDKPLHLAVLNNNLTEVNKLLEKRKGESDLDFDLGGRTPLHLAAAWGSRHSFPQTNVLTKSRITVATLRQQDHRINFVDSQVLEILEKVFSINEFANKSDNLMGWYAIDYALRSYSLDVLEIMFRNTQPENVLDFLDKISLIYYCVRCGYKNILASLTIEDYYMSIDNESQNLLHVAVDSYKNSFEVLEILLNKCTPSMIRFCLLRRDLYGTPALTRAARKGNLKVFQMLLKYKVDLNKADIYGLTALHSLVIFGHLECLKELLQENIDLNARTAANRKRDLYFKNPGHTALYFAVNSNNLEMVKLLTRHGANAHLKYENERTLLHVASVNGFTDCIQELFNHGAQIHCADDSDRTPLHYAVFNCKIDSVNYLLRLGADINKGDVFDRTPLHYATQNFRLDQMEIPPGSKLDVQKKDKAGRTPLHYASQKIKVESIKYLLQFRKDLSNWHHYGSTRARGATHEDKLCNMEFLVQLGGNPNEGDDVGRTPLHYAAEQNMKESVECLVKLGADLNRRDNYGHTPLFEATQRGNLDVVKFLLQFSPDPDKADRFKVTPLHVAAERGTNKCAQMLIESGASVNSVTVDGCTALFIAVKRNNEKLVKLLVENKANVNKSSRDTFLDGNPNCMAGNGKVDQNISAVNTLSPLHVAIQAGNLKIINALLESKLKINQPDSNGWTALHFAADGERLECIDGLVKRGAGLHLQAKDGSTPLHLAAKLNHCTTLEVLVRSKCAKALNQFNNEMQTALHIASSQGCLDCVKWLVASGADINLCTGEGYTPLNLAVNQGHLNIQKYLEQLLVSD